MIKTQLSDKKKFIELLSLAFAENKSVLTVVKNKKAIPHLMEYCFYDSFYDELAFTNESKTAIILCKSPSSGKFHIRKVWAMVKLAICGIGINNLGLSLKREKLINQKRLEKDFLYILFLGVEPSEQRKGYGSALLQSTMNYAKGLGLPMYLETSTLANLSLYNKLGFTNFHTMGAYGYNLYFFRKE